MGIFFDLGKLLFGKKNRQTYEEDTPRATRPEREDNEERIEKLRLLEEEMFEKMRNHEVEQNVENSLNAVECMLTGFSMKARSIAGWIVCEKSMNKAKIRQAFIDGAKVGEPDYSLKNSMRIPKAADYYFEHYYNEQKQLEIYNAAQEIKKAYEKKMDEVE